MENSYTKRQQEWKPKKRLENMASCIKEESGYMTVFGCLLFLTVMSLLFLCLDGCLIYQAEARCSMAQTGLGEHLLANYNTPLARRYHLYFLDPKMGEEELEERARNYYDELFYGSSESGLFSPPLLDLETKYIEAEPFGTMQEQECKYLITQIKEYMKYDMTKDLVLEALGAAAQETEEQNGQIEETARTLDEKQSAVEDSASASAENTLMPSENAEDNQADSIAQNSSPMRRIRSILEYGIMGIVTDESTLSERKISSSLLPFQNQKENKIDISMKLFENLTQVKELLTEQNLDQLTESLTDKGALSLYMQKYFNYYGKESVISDTCLLYEAEYILGGQYSDKENLEYVINRLVLLRFALNSAYCFTDEELRSQAFSMAALLTGVTGTPELVEAVRYMILAAVNLIESVTDVEVLMDGNKVPLVKTKSTWKTAISGQSEGISSSGNSGLEYKDYLLLLLLLKTDTNQQCLRMQNLMQLNIQQEQPEFQIKKCYGGIRLRSGVIFRTRFYAGEYLFEHKESYEY